MTRFMKTTIAALFGATMLAAPALAQVTGDDPTMDPGSDQSQAVIDSSTTAAVGSDYEGAMSRVGDAGVRTTIASMAEMGDVRVVGISTLKGVDGNQPRVDQALAQNDAEIQQLRSMVSSNPKITAALEARGMTASDVIAADVAANGSVIVYTR